MFRLCLMWILSHLKGVKQHLHLHPHRGELFGDSATGIGTEWYPLKCNNAPACVCVWREDVGEGKWGFAEWQMNGELKDTEGEAIFPESGRRKKKKKGSEMWEALRRQRKRQRRDSHTSSDQRAVSPVYSCETHWRCLSGQLTQVCLHFPLTSFIRVFVCSSRQLWVSKTRSDIFFFFLFLPTCVKEVTALESYDSGAG